MPTQRNGRGRASTDSDGNPKEAPGRLADELMWLDRASEGELPGGVFLRDLRFKVPVSQGGEWFGIARGLVEDVAVVGFTSAPRLEDCVHLTVARLLNGSMKWREDQYANQESAS